MGRSREQNPLLMMGLKSASPAAVQAATILSAIEVGLGSLLHAFHVPLAGQFLSINQAFILSRAVAKNRGETFARRLPATVSNIAAILKSLSPAGKKLTPMLAISSQGLLMSVGTVVFGANAIGCAIGAALLGLWAFIQPVAFYYLLFGKVLIQASEYLFGERNLIVAVIIAVGLKTILCVGVAVGAFLLPTRLLARYEDKMVAAGAKVRERALPLNGSRSFGENVVASLKDLTNPIFLVSLAMTCFFFYFAQADSSQMIWALMRPLALGFLGFLIARTLPIHRWLPRDTQGPQG